MRRAPTDNAVDHDQRRPVRDAFRFDKRRFERGGIVRVIHMQGVPVVTAEAALHIVAIREVGVAFNRHAVTVVNPDQIRQLQMPGERGRFVRDAFHHIAVAAERIHAVIEQGRVRLVEVAFVPARRHRHADAIA